MSLIRKILPPEGVWEEDLSGKNKEGREFKRLRHEGEFGGLNKRCCKREENNKSAD